MHEALVTVVRMPEKFLSDDTRVITRPFMPGGEERIKRIIDRLLALPEKEVHALLAYLLTEFATRHRDIGDVFLEQFRQATEGVYVPADISAERRMLIGSYFTMEYSIESAALFNPSIVPHPNQDGLADGSMRFLMSLRATGEGHVSSIVFRTGVIDASEQISFDPVSRYVERARKVKNRLHNKERFF